MAPVYLHFSQSDSMQHSHSGVTKRKSPRWIENLHILLWLIKDTCWALVWRPGAIIMIIPTMSVAFYLLYRSKHSKTELAHNAAVCMWITANSIWMIGEFYNTDLRYIAVVFFGIGLLILLLYYLLYFVKDMREEE